METLENMYTKLMGDYENVQAARGCNQHKHVPGCPDANGIGPDVKKAQANKQPVSLRKQLEQARQEAIALVRSGRAQTPEHQAALRKMRTIEEAYEKEKLQERIAIRKRERAEEESKAAAKQASVSQIKKMSRQERSNYAEKLGKELQQLEMEQVRLRREMEKAEKENRSTRDLTKRYSEWRVKYENWKKKSNEFDEAIGWN